MWTTPKDLKAQLARLWACGDLLRDAVTGNSRFPLRLSLKSPNSADITDHFHEVRAFSAELAAIDFVRIEWQEVRHRIQGVQRLPGTVWVDTIENALILLEKRREWDRFMALVSATREAVPVLLPWLEKRPLVALAHHDEWAALLAVVGWLLKHPRPGIYLRQLDLPKVHSKFIERHRGVLGELLDLALPAAAIDHSKTGVAAFAVRYGFLEKPLRVRFRVLDRAIQTLPLLCCPDISLDAQSFSHLHLPVRSVFITENEINFLAFPKFSRAMVIFGAGYGFDGLAQSPWLKNCRLYYWGDIDTHGFGILDQLRGHFPEVLSFLMDRETLDAHAEFWGNEEKPLLANLQRLNTEEEQIFHDLQDNKIRKHLRLEQEHISFDWLSQRLSKI